MLAPLQLANTARHLKAEHGSRAYVQTGSDCCGSSSEELLDNQEAWIRWKWTRSKYFKPAVEYTNGIMSALCVVLYVWFSYHSSVLQVLNIASFIASWTFLVEYIASFIAASNKVRFVIGIKSLIDLACIVQGYVNYVGHGKLMTQVNFIRLLRMFPVLRFFKSLSQVLFVWIQDATSPGQLELWRRGLDLFLAIFAVVFIGGSAFYEIEGNTGSSSAPQYLHQGWYWACVTVTTIGYGDFSPSTALGQMLFPLLIIIILIVIPNKVNALTSVLQVMTKHVRKVYKAWRFGGHVVLMGHVNHMNALSFIDEFFHPDRGMQDMDLVILQKDPPGPDMSMLLMAHRACGQIKFMQGSPFVTADLARVDLARSTAVFVMSNKYTQDPVEEDRRTLMVVLCISAYLRQYAGKSGSEHVLTLQRGLLVMMQSRGSYVWRTLEGIDEEDLDSLQDHVPHIIAQFHHYESVHQARRLLEQQMQHPRELGMLPVESTLFPLCIGAFKHALLGASLHAPGLVTLMTNLVTTTTVPPAEKMRPSGWLQEYLSGAGQELYEITFQEAFDGLSYQAAAQLLYEQSSVILLAVRNLADADDSQRFTVLIAAFDCPCVIQAGVSVGYILTDSQDVALKCSGQALAPDALRARPASSDVMTSAFRDLPGPRSSKSGGPSPLYGSPSRQCSLSSTLQPTVIANRNGLYDVQLQGQYTPTHTQHTVMQGAGKGWALTDGQPVCEGYENRTQALQASPHQQAVQSTGVHTAWQRQSGTPHASALNLDSMPAVQQRLQATQSPSQLPTNPLQTLASDADRQTEQAEKQGDGNQGDGKRNQEPYNVFKPSSWMPGLNKHSVHPAGLKRFSKVVNVSRSTQQHLRRLSESYRLQSVDELTWHDHEHNVVVISGSSCFNHLEDVLRGMQFSNMSHKQILQQQRSDYQQNKSQQVHSSKTDSSMSTDEKLQQTEGSTEGAVAEQPPPEQPTRYHSLLHARVVLVDPVGPSDTQAMQLGAYPSLVHLRGSLLDLADVRKLQLPKNCMVRALILPDLLSLEEGAAMGTTACKADAYAIQVASNLRQYCEYVHATLELWVEVVQPPNIPYLLPLCVGSGPYQPVVTVHGAGPTQVKEQEGGVAPSSLVPHHEQFGGTPTLMANREHQSKRDYLLTSAPLPPLVKTMNAAHKCCKSKTQQEAAGEQVARALTLNPALAPTLASGHILTGVILDKLFCQVLFNPLLLQMLSKLLGVWEEEDVTALPTTQEQPEQYDWDAEAQALPVHHLAHQHDAARTTEVQQMARPRNHLEAQQPQQQAMHAPPCQNAAAVSPTSPHVYLLPVPKLAKYLSSVQGSSLVHWEALICDATVPPSKTKSLSRRPTWRDLFLSCCHRHILPIGLYRRDTRSGFPYVYTAPSPDTHLATTDEVYVVTMSGPLQMVFQD